MNLNLTLKGFKKYMLTLMLATISILSFAQVQVIIPVNPAPKPVSMQLCGADSSFLFQVVDPTAAINGATVTLNLPMGAMYKPGTIATDIGTIVPLSLADLNTPTFTLSGVPASTSAVVSFNLDLICGFDNGTASFSYDVNGASNSTGGLNNVFTPSLTISAKVNDAVSLAVNDSVIRSYTVNQVGVNASMDTLFLVDIIGADAEVLRTSVSGVPGDLYGVFGDTVVYALSSAHFMAAGLGTTFDDGESLIVEEEVKLTGCGDASSDIIVSWGCYGNFNCNGFVDFANISLGAGNPNINIVSSSRVSPKMCTDGGETWTVTNNGTEGVPGGGTAYNVQLGTGLANCVNCTGFTVRDFASYSASINGNAVNVTTGTSVFGSGGNGGYRFAIVQLTSDPDGPGGLDDLDGDGFFDDLAVGESFDMDIVIDWIHDAPSTLTCEYLFQSNLRGTQMVGAHWRDQCDAAEIKKFATAEQPTWGWFGHRFAAYANWFLVEPNLFDGDETSFNFTYSNDFTPGGCDATDSIVMKLFLPDGLVLGSSFTPFLTYSSTNYTATNSVQIGDTVYVSFNLLRSGDHIIHVPVQASCPATIVNKNFSVEFEYYCEPDVCNASNTLGCSGPLELTYQTHCPTPCTGVYTDGFTATRTTLGWTDNTGTTRVTPSTPGIDLQAGSEMDRVTIDAWAHISGSVSTANQFFEVFYKGIDDPGSPAQNVTAVTLDESLLDVLSASVTFNDGGTDIICASVPFTTSYNVADTKHSILIDIESLFAGGGCFAGLSLSDGDSLRVQMLTKINDAPYVARYIPDFTGYFYEDVAGTPTYCDLWVENFKLETADFQIRSAYSTSVKAGCNNILTQSGYLYQSNGANKSDDFPNEYRPAIRVNSLVLRITGDYSQINWAQQTSTRGIDNTASGAAINSITPATMSFDGTYTYFTFTRDASWLYFDDWSNAAQVQIRNQVIHGCMDAGTLNFYETVNYTKFYYADPVDWVDESDDNSTNIAYVSNDADMVDVSVVQNGLTDTVEWEIRLDNLNNFGGSLSNTIENNWLAFESSVINVVEVEDVATGTVYSTAAYGGSNTWAQIGDLNFGDAKVFKIRATYTTCTFDSILVRFGNNCIGYPFTPDQYEHPSGGFYSCSDKEKTTFLYVDPKDIDINLTLTSPAGGQDLCTEQTYVAEITNTQLSNAYNHLVTADLPTGIAIVNSSSQIRYPAGSGAWTNVSNPVNTSGSIFEWDLSGDLALIGGSGPTTPDNNYEIRFRITTDCDFISGERIFVTVSAENPCGTISDDDGFSDPLDINGVAIPNIYAILANENPIEACGPATTFKVKIVNLGGGSGVTSSLETMTFNIDSSQSFVMGSFNGIHNPPPTGVIGDTTLPDGTRTLTFDVPAGVITNDSIVFEFDLETLHPELITCDSLPYELRTLTTANVTCATAPGGNCNIAALSANSLGSIQVKKADIAIVDVSGTSTIIGSTEAIVLDNIKLKNNSDTDGPASLILEFYYDANNDGVVDAGDNLLSATTVTGVIAANDSLTTSHSFNASTLETCSIIASIKREDNGCVCDDNEFVIQNIRLLNAGMDQDVCQNETVQIGSDAVAGWTYAWSGLDANSALTSMTASNPTFSYNDASLATTVSDEIYLETTKVGGCVSTDTVVITVNPLPMVTVNGPTSICLGESVSLTASGADTYLWNPGNLTTASINVAPSSNTNYTVNVSFAASGCAVDTSVLVTVLPSSTASISSSNASMCQSDAARELVGAPTGGTFLGTGIITSVSASGFSFDPTTATVGANTISYAYENASGCTDTAYQTIQVLANPTVSFNQMNSALCDVDPVFGLTTTPSGATFTGNGVIGASFDPSLAGAGTHEVYATYTGGNGCTSSDTLVINVTTCVDSDNDGVVDSRDLDDDNDGILDTDEMDCSGTSGGFSWVGATNGDLIANFSHVSGLTGTFTNVLAYTAEPGYPQYTIPGSTELLFYRNAGGKTPGSETTIDFNEVVTGGELRFTGIGEVTNPSGSGFDESQIVKFYYLGQEVVMSPPTVIDSGSYDPATGLILGNSSGPGNTIQAAYYFTINQPIDQVVFTNIDQNGGIHGEANWQLRLRNICVELDTDNDGDPDHLDTDSDDDGCSDANEAYADVNADGGDDEVFGTSPVTVDASGLVTGPTAASYTTGAVPAVVDDNDATACNEAPDVVETPTTTDEDTPVDFCPAISDPNMGDVLTTGTCGGGSNGVMSPSGTADCFTYTPATDFNGIDTVCTYVCDQDGLCDTAYHIITVDPVNDTPTIAQPPIVIEEDSVVEICPTINDIDDANTTLVVTLCATPANGSAVETPPGSGCYEYTPNADFNGVDTLCFTVCDPSGACSEIEVPVTITPVNDAPIAVDDAVTTDEETLVTIDILVNDNDTDTTLNPASVTAIDGPSNGTLGTIDPVTGEIPYTPATDFFGMDTITYSVCDNGIPMPALCDTAIVVITVNPVNDTPTIAQPPIVIEEDSVVEICPMVNDTDDANTTLVVTLCATPANGSAVETPPGSGCYEYTPNADFNGVDTLCFTVCDPSGACSEIEVPVTITPVNDAPIAVDDAVTTDEETLVTIDILVNDNDTDTTLNPASVTAIDGPSNGTLGTIDPVTGEIPYTPDPNFVGMDTITYSVCDNGIPMPALCDTAIVVITVENVNDTPTIVQPPVTVPEDSVIEICPIVSDTEDPASLLTTGICGGSDNGTTTPAAGCFEYTPNADFNGVDTVCFYVCDTDGACDTVLVPITITPVNDPPVAVDNVVTTDEEDEIIVDVLNNDTDTDTTLNPGTVAVIDGPSNGTLGTIDPVTGEIPYTPAADFVGMDTITYTVCDNGIPMPALCDTAMIIITVEDVNDTPVIVQNPVVVPEDSTISICPTVSDVEDPTTLLTTGICGGPMNGTATPAAGCFDYTPNANFNGPDTLCLYVCDTDGACDTVLVPINVVPLNDAPIAVDDNAIVDEDASVVIDVLGNDIEVDTTLDISSVTVITPADSGLLTIDPSTGAITYTPNPDFCGMDTFTYSMCDLGSPAPGLCDTADVFIDVTCVNDTPTIVQPPVTVPEDSVIEICPMVNDIDDANATLSVTLCELPDNGTVVGTTPGCFEYTPDPDFNGTDTICISVCDPSGACSEVEIPITITPENDAPIAVDDAVTTDEETLTTIDVLANDSDTDTTLNAGTVTVIDGPSNGTLGTIDPVTGEIPYTPATDFFGMDTITYSVCDNGIPMPALCDTAIVVITVEDVNDPPVIVQVPVTVPEDSVIEICPTVTDTEDPTSLLTTGICGGPTNGTPTVGATGCIQYTPNADFNGQDTMCFFVCDTDGACDTVLVPITVAPVNDAPIAVDDAVTTDEETLTTIDVLANDSDTDTTLNAGTVAVIDGPSNGTLGTIDPVTGEIPYTPATDFEGMDTITYTVCDNGIPMPALCDTAEIIITVVNVNDTPVIIQKPVVVPEDSTISICPMVSDVEDASSLLTVGICGGPTNGTAPAGSPAGCFDYTPDLNYNGPDTICFYVCDTDGACDTVIVPISVVPLNDAPIAVDDNAIVDEGSSVIVDILGNDIEVDTAFDISSVTVVAPADSGVLSIDPITGAITYTPNTDFCGLDTFTYSICDLGSPAPGLCDTADVFIDVTCVNDTPTIVQPPVTVPEDSVIEICPIVNDIDDANPTLSVTLCELPDNGTVVGTTPGCFEYTPDPDFNGTDTICISVCDPSGACSEVEVPITITPENDPPIAVDDIVNVNEDDTITVDILMNDSDTDTTLNAGSVTVLDGPSSGTISIDPVTGEIEYIPTPDFEGMDTITYYVCDNGTPMPALCDTADVIITVNPVNDTPTIVQPVITVPEDSVIEFCPVVDDIDDANTTLSVTVCELPMNGTLVATTPGCFEYTPNPDFNGTDTICISVCDPSGACSEVTIPVIVPEVNDVPVVTDDVATTNEEDLVTIDVLDNDSDVDTTLDVTSVTVVDMPNGIVNVLPTGEIEYTPPTNFVGMDTFTYFVCDNGNPLPALCDTAEVIVTVNPVNDPLVAVNDSVTTNEDMNAVVQVVVMSDTDIDGNPVPSTTDLDPSTPGTQLVFGTSNGVYTTDGFGNVTFTPNTNFNGVDSTPYVVCDDGTPLPGLCDTAMIYVFVTPVNDAPIAGNDVGTANEDGSTTVNVVSNDDDPNDPMGNIDPASIDTTGLVGPMNGTITNITATGEIQYTPNTDFNGVDSFQYVICDDGNPLPAMCDTAWVVITVDPVQDDPIIVDDVATVDEDEFVVIDVLSNDNDSIDGSLIDPTTVAEVTSPNNGTILIDPVTGEITYIPNTDFNGVDTFEYVVCDSGIPLPQICDTAEVIVTVNAVNDAPNAVTDTASVDEDNSVDIDVVANDNDSTDPLGNIDSTSVTIVDAPLNGSVTIDPVTGVVTYTPNPNFNGVDSFQYQVCDDGNPLPALCDTTWVVVTVNPVNDVPVAVTDDNDTTVEGIPVVIDVLSNDSDPNDPLGNIDPTTVGEITPPMNGTITIDPVTGEITYTPDPGFFGTDMFEYVVCDDGNPLPATCDTALVTVTVLQDTDNDGIPNITDIDDDNDGILDTVEDAEPDADNDGIPNSLDNDSDNDGIPDNVEGQTTDGFIPLSGVDVDMDGLDDAYDNDLTGAPNSGGIEDPIDTDGDGIDDYLDVDSDGDGIVDAIEGFDDNGDGVADVTPSGSDDNENGIDDAYENLGNPLTDTDVDAIPNFRDIDDDNDGVSTLVENGFPEDCDNDGIPNYLDSDVCIPVIPEGISPNGDGMNDAWVIEGLEYYPNHEIWIFNRWGNKVYETEDYKNDWRGTNNFGVSIANENLPEGTYFYILETGIEGQAPLKGFIYITK